jgi:hypothetical protein
LGSFGILTSVVALGPARIETVSPAVTAERQRSVNHAFGITACFTMRFGSDATERRKSGAKMRHLCVMRRIDGLAP